MSIKRMVFVLSVLLLIILPFTSCESMSGEEAMAEVATMSTPDPAPTTVSFEFSITLMGSVLQSRLCVR